MSRDGREFHCVARTSEGEVLSKDMFLTLPGVSEDTAAIQCLILTVYYNNIIMFIL